MRRLGALLGLLLLLPLGGGAQTTQCSYTTESQAACSESLTSETWTTACVCKPFGGHPTLANGLISYWRLNEQSTGSAAVTRYDSHGPNDLEDNATTTSTSGKSGPAALFAAGLEMLTYSTSTKFTMAGGATFSAWINPRINDTKVIFSFDNNTTERRWDFDILAGPVLRFRIWDTTNTFRATGTPAVTLNTFSLIVCWYDPADNLAHFSINDSETTASAALTGGPDLGEEVLRIGKSLAAPNGYDGKADEMAFWNRVLTAEERTALYNAGAGRFY